MNRSMLINWAMSVVTKPEDIIPIEKLISLINIHSVNTISTSKSTSPDDNKTIYRVKKTIPNQERCLAIKGKNNIESMRCTRRRQNHQFCGTHIRNTPIHIITEEYNTTGMKPISIWVQDIKGIMYHIDQENNIYDPEDILRNTSNPKIIGTWKINTEGEYSINLNGNI